MARSVLLVVNRQRAEAAASAAEVSRLIREHGHLAGEVDTGERESAGLRERAAGVDLVIVLGGDGSILGQARRMAGLTTPLLGVNFGRLGFIAEFELSDFVSQVKEILSPAGGEALRVRRLPMIEATIEGRGGMSGTALALNEVVVTAGAPFRVIQLSLRFDGVAGPMFHGDGLIVATPTGSTAYNLSAGGPIVAPLTDGFIITPIAPQSLSFRPIVVPGETEIDLDVVRANDDGGSGGYGTTLILDGQVMQPLRQGDRVRLRRSDTTLNFVVNPRADFWSALTHKLRWAEPPRIRG